jgi:hypothetical protein
MKYCDYVNRIFLADGSYQSLALMPETMHLRIAVKVGNLCGISGSHSDGLKEFCPLGYIL